MAEKCTAQLPPIRVPESLEHALMRLAAHEDRSLSEYVKLVLSRHVYGHAVSLDLGQDGGKAHHA